MHYASVHVTGFFFFLVFHAVLVLRCGAVSAAPCGTPADSLFCPPGQWKRFSLVRRPRVPPKPDPSPEEAALPRRTCLLHTTCLPTQVRASGRAHAATGALSSVKSASDPPRLSLLRCSASSPPRHLFLQGCSFKGKAGRVFTSPPAPSRPLYSCVFAVFRSRCLGTVGIAVLLSPILGLICLLSIIDASCTP